MCKVGETDLYGITKVTALNSLKESRRDLKLDLARTGYDPYDVIEVSYQDFAHLPPCTVTKGLVQLF